MPSPSKTSAVACGHAGCRTHGKLFPDLPRERRKVTIKRAFPAWSKRVFNLATHRL
jgi:hypothetical protein